MASDGSAQASSVDTVAGASQCAQDPSQQNYEDVLCVRQQYMAKNATLSYQEPVLMVSARGATMEDHAGTQWLDCANNVAHVGHCNPQVRAFASMAARQQSMLMESFCASHVWLVT